MVKVPATALSASPSTSLSFAIRLTVPVSVASSPAVTASSAATGGSFAGVTSIVTVYVFSLPRSSMTVKLKLSVPLKSGAGVYW